MSSMTATASTNPKSLADLAKLWAAAQSGSAIFLWKFSAGLLTFAGENPKLSMADIGTGIDRSRTFVSRALKAARQFPNAPTVEKDQRAFVDLFWGNQAQTAARAAGTTTTATPKSADEALRGAIRLAKLAVRRGLASADVVEKITHAIETGVISSGTGAEPGTVKLDSGKAAAAARTRAKATQNQAHANQAASAA